MIMSVPLIIGTELVQNVLNTCGLNKVPNILKLAWKEKEIINTNHNAYQQQLQLGSSQIIYNTTPTPNYSVPCSF